MLVEALVALSVLTMGFLGILTLLSRSTALTRVVSDNYTATYLAAEGIEIIKNLVDANVMPGGGGWGDGFIQPSASYEVDYQDDNPNNLEVFNPDNFLNLDLATHLYSYRAGGSPTPFKRQVTVSFPNADEMQVVSNVFWTGRGGSPSRVLVEDHFYNWRL